MSWLLAVPAGLWSRVAIVGHRLRPRRRQLVQCPVVRFTLYRVDRVDTTLALELLEI